MRAGLGTCLRVEDGFDIVGEAASGAEALQRARELDPDVVLMEMILSDGGGVDVIRAMRRALSGVRVVVLTALADELAAEEAIRAGAAAYVLKDAPLEILRESIRLVTSDRVRLASGAAAARSIERPFGVTARELQVLTEIAEGKINKEIARTLGVSQETAKTYVKRILAKLGVENRTEAAIVAVSRGLVRPRNRWSV